MKLKETITGIFDTDKYLIRFLKYDLIALKNMKCVNKYFKELIENEPLIKKIKIYKKNNSDITLKKLCQYGDSSLIKFKCILNGTNDSFKGEFNEAFIWCYKNNFKKELELLMKLKVGLKCKNLEILLDICHKNFLNTDKFECLSKDQTSYIFSCITRKFTKVNEHCILKIINLENDCNLNGLEINKLISKLVITNRTPHIIVPLFKFESTVKSFMKFINCEKMDLEMSTKFKQISQNNKKIAVVIYTNDLRKDCISCEILSEFLKKNYKNFSIQTWKTIFFQIFSLLFIIQIEYPTFVHNNFTIDNILICKLLPLDKKLFYKYNFKKKSYIVPNIGYQIKLENFNEATIENNLINKYFDIHSLLNSLLKEKFYKSIHIQNEVKDFINRNIPIKYRINDSRKLLTIDEFTSPEEILTNDSFFNDFLKH